jgi:hypothetical protein
MPLISSGFKWQAEELHYIEAEEDRKPLTATIVRTSNPRCLKLIRYKTMADNFIGRFCLLKE